MNFLFSSVRTASGALGIGLSPHLMRPDYFHDHLSPCNVEVKNGLGYTSSPLYALRFSVRLGAHWQLNSCDDKKSCCERGAHCN